jgi:hypothetical protein
VIGGIELDLEFREGSKTTIEVLGSSELPHKSTVLAVRLQACMLYVVV